MSMEILGLTEKAGSRKDSLNFPFTLVPLEKRQKSTKGQNASSGTTSVKPTLEILEML